MRRTRLGNKFIDSKIDTDRIIYNHSNIKIQGITTVISLLYWAR